MTTWERTMRSHRLHAPGGPEALVLDELPRPRAAPGQVLIEVRAFGLNRSEWLTRNGDSPTVQLPRVLGIECVGTVLEAPGGEVAPGQRVAAMMGGMGREFDGSYAELTCVPASSVFPLETALDWPTLAALPEVLQTCHGSLRVGLGVQAGETLLIRGGTASVGLTALAMARALGLEVIATTRTEAKRELLHAHGARHVLVDDGHLADQVRRLTGGGADRVLELIGATTLLDSLACARPGGVVCMTGILGGAWELARFQPMTDIPTGVRLTSYSGGAADITAAELQAYVAQVEAGALRVPLGPVWRFDQLVLAHREMDANRANGKMVVVIDP